MSRLIGIGRQVPATPEKRNRQQCSADSSEVKKGRKPKLGAAFY